VERRRIGGDCTWTGCVPSKTLLKVAKVAHLMRTAGRYGLAPAVPQVDLKAVMAHVRRVIAGVYEGESPDALRERGIDVYLDEARFLDPHTLAVGEDTLTAGRFLIATGAHPFLSPIEGLGNVDYATYETVWEMEALPRRLLVVGAGPLGCEMAQAFRRMGSQVVLIASRDRILPRDEPAASRLLGEVFTAEGIDVRYDARARRVWKDASGIHVAGGEREVVGDALLLAVGRRPNVESLDLERAGVAYTPRGISVDGHLCTNVRHIYAAGDCTGGLQFAHYAGRQAFLAVRNALLPGALPGVTDHVPWTTFTDPEVAHVGLTEAQARERLGDRVETCEWPMADVDRARAEGAAVGFIKLVYEGDGTLLGATVVAERAGETIHEWIVALERGMKVDELAGTIHVYPTYSTASMQAAKHIRLSKLLGGMSGRIVRGLARFME
jgi:pyruvate/2-oxoglutarate dehydrogenase complex dihydrolipoamide dehydrogenase (E3) component